MFKRLLSERVYFHDHSITKLEYVIIDSVLKIFFMFPMYFFTFFSLFSLLDK